MSETDTTDDKEIWANSAAQYKKDGEIYSKVDYDHKGNPVRIRVAQDQIRKGEFDMDGGVAVYDPHKVPTLPDAGEETLAYVKSLPFVDSVDMSAIDTDN